MLEQITTVLGNMKSSHKVVVLIAGLLATVGYGYLEFNASGAEPTKSQSVNLNTGDKVNTSTGDGAQTVNENINISN